MSKNNLEIITLNKQNITDFALERNNLIKKSRASWIFFVDSDEEVPPELMKEIYSQINKVQTFVSGFYIKRKNYFLGQYVGEDNIVRLGKKSAGKWQRAVHEVWKIKGKIGEIKNPLIHNTANSLSAYINKINFYSVIHTQENIREGKSSSLFKIIFYPFFKFIKNILMGRGFVFSMLQSLHSFLSWSQMWLSQHKIKYKYYE